MDRACKRRPAPIRRNSRPRHVVAVGQRHNRDVATAETGPGRAECRALCQVGGQVASTNTGFEHKTRMDFIMFTFYF